jgi:hypothetical protein
MCRSGASLVVDFGVAWSRRFPVDFDELDETLDAEVGGHAEVGGRLRAVAREVAPPAV